MKLNRNDPQSYNAKAGISPSLIERFDKALDGVLPRITLAHLDEIPGLVAAMIKADTSGEIAKLVKEGSVDFATERFVAKLRNGFSNPNQVRTLDAASGAHLASYFERQNVVGVQKMRVPQRPNKNVIPGSQELGVMGGNSNSHGPTTDSSTSDGVANALDEATKSFDAARTACSRWHQFQGHTNCSFCKGVGFKKAEQDRLNKAAGTSSPNHSRMLMPGHKG